MSRAKSKGGRGGESGPKGAAHVGDQDPDTALEQDDLANDIKGDNKLQGDDQLNVRNERRRQSHGTRKTEGVVESFERMDPERRDREDGKDEG